MQTSHWTTWWMGAGLLLPFHAAWAAGTLSGTRLETDHAWAELGIWVAHAGDVDGDGYPDLVAGAPYFEPVAFGPYVGQAVLFTGGAAGLSPVPDWAFTGTQPDEKLGRLVAAAGDVDDDGYADVLVSAPEHDTTLSNAGRVWLFRGGSGGLSATPAWSATGDRAGAFLGAIASAGDVDGDGYSDVIVGAPNRGGGTAYLYRGGAGGLSATPAWTREDPDGGSSFGFCVAGAGDVDGDGYDDVVVGSYSFHANAGAEAGRVQLFRGGAAGLAATAAWTVEGAVAGGMLGVSVAGAGDVNRDGYDDVVVAAPVQGSTGEVRLYLGSAAGLASTPVWVRHGSAADGWMGSAVAGAGDFNADGYADVVVGAYAHEDTQPDEGQVFIFLGSPAGLPASPAWVGAGGQPGAHLGLSVTAGDFDDDGFSDVAAGAPLYTSEEMHVEEGAVFVFEGCADANRDGVCGDTAVDTDHDGDPDPTDCAPINPAIHHGAVDVPGDGTDQDCGGSDAVACVVDMDHDGYPGTPTTLPDGPCAGPGLGTSSTDCDDARAAVHVDCGSPPADAGSQVDAGSQADAAVAPPADGSVTAPDASTADAAAHADAGGPDAGSSPRPDAGTPAGGGGDQGESPGACGCTSGAPRWPAGLVGLAAGWALLRRRRAV
ncbi:MAG: FG-GAP repeat protein [Deltaproteobacteria bacterium]|nr:FG-GAP repeat protein [Deltaproteobacteria bacterium]